MRIEAIYDDEHDILNVYVMDEYRLGYNIVDRDNSSVTEIFVDKCTGNVTRILFYKWSEIVESGVLPKDVRNIPWCTLENIMPEIR